MSKFQKREVLESPKFAIHIGGKPLGEDMLKFVESVTVEDEDNLLPIANITVSDVERKWLNDTGIVKGTKVAVSVGHQANIKQIFHGTINYIEGDFPDTGIVNLTIGCVDVANKLTKSRKARSWKKRKISDIISIMHKEANVKVVVQDTKVLLDHVVQDEGSNLDFILDWKDKLGAKYYKISPDTYYFGMKARNLKATQTLSYMTGGHEIVSFRPVYQAIEKEDETIQETEIDKDGNEVKVKMQVQPPYSQIGDTPVGKAKPKSK